MRPPEGAKVRGAAEPRGWKPGPMPEGTWFWGAVVLAGEGNAMHFADFRGDHVLLFRADSAEPAVVEAAQIRWYDNGLTEPPVDSAGGS